jgi:5-formyltetrahydrofolate cyclo-ligase
MPKRKLRQAMLARRKALSAEDAKALSFMIQRLFIASVEFGKSAMVGLYSPIHNEVDTSEVLVSLLGSSRAALYPVVNGGMLVFRRVDSPGKMRSGSFGILEPDESCEVVHPDRADLIIVPGIAFDLTGKRVGYGKGYYDRTLHHLEGSGKLVGFCYECQLVEAILGEPHDVTMDLLITEKRVIRPRD